MNAISLVYGHDSRAGRQSYRFLAMSSRLSQSQLSEIEVVLTRLGFQARFVAETPGYFCLWLKKGVRLLGRASARTIDGKETLECRLLVVNGNETSPIACLHYLNQTEPWDPDGGENLPGVAISQSSFISNTGSAHSSPRISLPWPLIASSALDVIGRWYSGLESASQRSATFVAPSLIPQNKIENFSGEAHLAAAITPTATNLGKVKGPKAKPWLPRVIVPVLGFCFGIAFSLAFLNDSTPVKPPQSGSTHVEVPRPTNPKITLSESQEQELDKATKALTEFVAALESYSQWNRRLLDDPTNKALVESLRHTNRYLSEAADLNKTIDHRIQNLSFAIGDIAALITQIEGTGSVVEKLNQSLIQTEELLSKLERSLKWHRSQANQSFQAEVIKAQEVREEIESALRSLVISLDRAPSQIPKK